jgi:hypothetical protein
MLEDEKETLLRKNKQLTLQMNSQTGNFCKELEHQKN